MLCGLNNMKEYLSSILSHLVLLLICILEKCLYHFKSILGKESSESLVNRKISFSCVETAWLIF